MTEPLKMSEFFSISKRQSSPIPPEELSDMPELSLCKFQFLENFYFSILYSPKSEDSPKIRILENEDISK